MKLHSINTEQRLYVMRDGPGYSCYGFEVLDRKARAVAEWMRADITGPCMSDPTEAGPLGTELHFNQCARILDNGHGLSARAGKRCTAQLSPQLVGLEGQRVEVCYPDGQTERFYVGKSTGWMPTHLAIKTSRSHGGCAVSLPEGSTVRIIKQRRK